MIHICTNQFRQSLEAVNHGLFGIQNTKPEDAEGETV